MKIKLLLVELSNKPIVIGTEMFLLLGSTPLILFASLVVVLKGTYLPLAVLALLPVLKNVINLFAVYIHHLSLRTMGRIMIMMRVLSCGASILAMIDLELYLYSGIMMGILGTTLVPVFEIRYNAVVVELYADKEYHNILSGSNVLQGLYKLTFGLIAAGLYMIDVQLVIIVSLLVIIVAGGWGIYVYKKHWKNYK